MASELFSTAPEVAGVCSSQKPEQQLGNTHRIDSFSPLTFSDRMSDMSAGQRTSNRGHAQQPHHQPRRRRLLRLSSRGFLLVRPLLVGDEHLGKHRRGGLYGTFAVLDQPREPRHSTCAIRVRIKHATRRQRVSPHGGWKPKRPFSRTYFFAATKNKAHTSRFLQESRKTSAMRWHLIRG